MFYCIFYYQVDTIGDRVQPLPPSLWKCCRWYTSGSLDWQKSIVLLIRQPLRTGGCRCKFWPICQNYEIFCKIYHSFKNAQYGMPKVITGQEDNEVIIPRGFKTCTRPREFQIAWVKTRTKTLHTMRYVMLTKQSLWSSPCVQEFWNGNKQWCLKMSSFPFLFWHK